MYPQTSSNQNWLRLLADFDGFQGIYTDGLKAGAAARLQLPCQTSTNHLIYLLSESLWHFTFADHHGVRCSRWIPHTNILSFLPSENRELDQPLILKTVVTLHQLVGSSKRVIVVWLPSHTGLAGNMAIDDVAEVALKLQFRLQVSSSTLSWALILLHFGNDFGTPKPLTSESVRTLRWSFPNPYS